MLRQHAHWTALRDLPFGMYPDATDAQRLTAGALAGTAGLHTAKRPRCKAGSARRVEAAPECGHVSIAAAWSLSKSARRTNSRRTARRRASVAHAVSCAGRS